MNMVKRIITTVKAWINHLLDRAEDPEKVLNQALTEMEESFRRAKVDLARAMADQKRLENQVRHNRDRVKEWNAKAILAVQKGNDELAREALKRKSSYESLKSELNTHLKSQSQVTDQLKDSLRSLQLKIEEMRRKKNLLISRQQRALLQQKINESLKATSTKDPGYILNKLEEKINNLEAESAALESIESSSLEEKFKALENSSDLEDELSDLKRQYLPPNSEKE